MTMEQYRAVLYLTPSEDVEFLYVSDRTKKELSRPRPVDVCYLKDRDYSKAENIFYNKRGWKISPFLHIEIDAEPIIE